MMKMRARMYLVHIKPIEKKKIMAKFLGASYSLRHFLMLSEPCETNAVYFGGYVDLGGWGGEWQWFWKYLTCIALGLLFKSQ